MKRHEGVARGLRRCYFHKSNKRWYLGMEYVWPQFDDVGYEVGDAIITATWSLPIVSIFPDIDVDAPSELRDEEGNVIYSPPNEFEAEDEMRPVIDDLERRLRKAKLIKSTE